MIGVEVEFTIDESRDGPGFPKVTMTGIKFVHCGVEFHIVLVGRKAYADRGVPDVKQRLVLQRRRSLSFAAVDPCDSEVLST